MSSAKLATPTSLMHRAREGGLSDIKKIHDPPKKGKLRKGEAAT